jgi:hypothetical protein
MEPHKTYVLRTYCSGLPVVSLGAENAQAISNSPVGKGAHVPFGIEHTVVVPVKRLACGRVFLRLCTW